MTTNRLAKPNGNTLRSGKTASQWAQIARDRNDPEGAAAWERAARDGWDDAHYDATLRDSYDQQAKAALAQRGARR